MGNCIRLSTADTGDSFVEVLFFPDPKMPCKATLDNKQCTRKACTYSHNETNLLKLLRYLRSATKSLDICVFTITCNEIANEVLAAHNRGVRVRVITDDAQSKSLGSDIQKFIDAGIPTRDDNANTHMHHKFCIIDNHTLLNGSFNWSRQAVIGNAENLVVNIGGSIILQFHDYFEHLWVKYAANDRSK